VGDWQSGTATIAGEFVAVVADWNSLTRAPDPVVADDSSLPNNHQ
jgi:hypothetical protein